MPVGAENINNHAAFIWSVADLLRGDYKQSEYGRVILPFTVLRRLDCVLAPVKAEMLTKHAQIKDRVENFGPVLDALTDIEGLWNTSRFDLSKLLDDPDNLADNLRAYIHGFSPQATDILDKFDFPTQINRLDKSKLLYLVVSKFAELDLHPDKVSNLEMGYLYEELIRRFSELSNETAGEHFTPREVIRLMVDLLFAEDDDLLQRPGIKKTLFDPACGTGGMLSVAEDRLRQLNPNAHLEVFGQELNDETYAICRSDMMLKGQDASNIVRGNSLKQFDAAADGKGEDPGDGHPTRRFDYLLANPPFGVDWKKVEEEVRSEHLDQGFGGRFGAGLPPIDDGAVLFLQHMVSKMKTPEDGGSRLAIVFNGSPLFAEGPFNKPTKQRTGNVSEIRRWIIENDWLEAVVALPDQLFYNTPISTYFWIVTNRKRPERRGKVQLIDARESFTKMRKSLGEKRKQVSDPQTTEIVRLYGAFEENERSKIFDNEEFGFLRITVERPLRRSYRGGREALHALGDAELTYGKNYKGNRSADAEAVRDAVATMPGGLDRDAATEHLGGKQFTDLLKKSEDAVWEAIAIADPNAPIVTDAKGNPLSDSDVRDAENVPLAFEAVGRIHYEPDVVERLGTRRYRELIERHLTDEVLPYVDDAWIDFSKTKIGYEIPLTRHFYTYNPPRPLEEIDAEITALEVEIQGLLAEVTE